MTGEATILIVDDSEQMRKVTSAMLEESGYGQVITAASAEEAYDLLGLEGEPPPGEKVDLILMDVMMPDIDGLEACKKIKSVTHLQDIPIIMLTARTDDELLRDAFEAGASDYIKKPASMVELYSRIRAALNLKTEIDGRKAKEKSLRALTEELKKTNEEKEKILSDLFSAIDEITLKNFTLETEVDERQKVEEKLLSFKRAVHNMQIGITITDAEGKITYANPAEAAMHQYKPEELIGKDVRIFAPKKLWNPMKKKKLQKAGSLRRETVNLRRDGNSFPVQLHSDVVLNDQGEPIAVVTTSEDITERKSFEEALKKAHDSLEVKVEERTKELTSANESLSLSENEFRTLYQQFETLVNAIPDSLILFSEDLSILWSNKNTLNIFGLDEADMEGMDCPFVGQLYDNVDDWPVKRCFKSSREESDEVTTREGKRINLRAFPILDGGGKVTTVLELLTDETEKVHLQAEAMRAGHLASIGELSAGIAHEINNPANGIINCAELLLTRSGEDEKTIELATLVLSEGKRIARIVKALLAFARKRGEKKTPVDLKVVLSDTLALTEAHLRKDGIRLGVDFPAHLPLVMGNDQQIEQVFLNLINNARYALNQKETGENDKKELEIRAETIDFKKKEGVRISFSDNGPGISPKIIGKVLDPFFSTKPTSEGTGLGLSISHGIIHDHGGKFSIESEEGEFTRMIIELPAGKGC